MAIARNIVGSGIPPLAATNIVGDTDQAITATGSTQGTAYDLFAVNNYVSTTAASTGVQLQPCNPGDEIFVYNAGASTLSVYGQTGETINNGAANAAHSVATVKGAIYKKLTNTAWMAVLTA